MIGMKSPEFGSVWRDTAYTLPMQSKATLVTMQQNWSVPAMVLETQLVPNGVSLRTDLFARSATYTLPLPSTATLAGPENLMSLLVPSSLPSLPASPAIVLETQLVPAEVNLRMVLFPRSATNTLPSLPTATLAGRENSVGICSVCAALGPSEACDCAGYPVGSG